MEPSEQLSDMEWVALANDDPNAACRALLTRYGNYIYAVVCNYLRTVASREDLEDCVSDVLLAFLQNTAAYSPQAGTLKGYLGTLAKRTAIDMWRKLSGRQHRVFSLDDGVWEETLPAQTMPPDASAETHALQECLWRAVQALGPPDAEILVRQYFYRQTAKEIAQVMRLRVAQVQKRSQRARVKLRACLVAEEIGGFGWNEPSKQSEGVYAYEDKQDQSTGGMEGCTASGK